MSNQEKEIVLLLSLPNDNNILDNKNILEQFKSIHELSVKSFPFPSTSTSTYPILIILINDIFYELQIIEVSKYQNVLSNKQLYLGRIHTYMAFDNFIVLYMWFLITISYYLYGF